MNTPQMDFELVLSPALYAQRQLQESHVTVAVDILRATSALCAAFTAGAELIVPLDSLDPLPGFHQRGFLVAAERNGSKVPPAVCGNSPTEYLTMDLRGCRLAYSTTNGTVSILTARHSQRLYVGAFANLSAVAQRLAQERERRLVVLCSGWKGDPCIEDTLWGGALQEALTAAGVEVHPVNDAAMMAADLWQRARGDLYGYCSKATHVHRLQRLHYEDDIRWALQLDTCSVVPRYDSNLQALVL